MAFRTGNQAAPAAGTATRPASRAPQFETAGTSALAPAAPGKPVEIETAGGDHFSVSFEEVRHFICAKATDAECKIFLETCRAYRLNPFTREAYLIHYDNKSDETPATIVLGKNCYLQMAERHPAYDGFEAGVIVLNDGGVEYREGSAVYDGEELLGGWAKVYHKDRSRPNYEEVKLGEYNTGKSLWASKPATMIRKVALVHALREAFPSTYGLTYDESEIGVEVDAEGTARELDDDAPRSLPRSRKAPAQPAVEIVTADSPAEGPQDSEDDPFGGEDA